MNAEELKKEAEEYAEGMTKYYASTHEGFIPSQFEKYLRNACVSSAEPREKQIAELEAQIEKVKHYLDYDIPHDLINEATTKIWRMLK